MPRFEGENNEQLVGHLSARMRQTVGESHQDVVDALLQVDRGDFCPARPYLDSPARGEDYHISAPHMVAFALEYLHDYIVDDRTLNMLDIGVGTGYLAVAMAKLSHPKAKVVGIDVNDVYLETGRRNIRKNHGDLLDSKKIILVKGDGKFGCPEYAPYSVIQIGCAIDLEIGRRLCGQLAPFGALIAPINLEENRQELMILSKKQNGLVEQTSLMGVRFAMLREPTEEERANFDDLSDVVALRQAQKEKTRHQTVGEESKEFVETPGDTRAETQSELLALLLAQEQSYKSLEPSVLRAIDAANESDRNGLLEAMQNTLAEQNAILMDVMMNLERFLTDIVLYQNKLDKVWGLNQEVALRARAQYATNIQQYEEAEKVKGESSAFPSLFFRASTSLKDKFQMALDELESRFQARGIHVLESSGARVKAYQRAFWKAFFVYAGEIGKLSDILRASFVFDSFEHVYAAVSELENVWEQHGGILRIKDRYIPMFAPFGYRDLLVNVYCPQSQVVCEIQFHHTLLYQEKHNLHAVYKKARLFNRPNGSNEAYDFAESFIRPKIGDDALPDENLLKRVMTMKQINVAPEGVQEGATGESQMEDFRDILGRMKMEKFADRLEEEGYDDPRDWPDISEDELREMGFKNGHLKKWQRYLADPASF